MILLPEILKLRDDARDTFKQGWVWSHARRLWGHAIDQITAPNEWDDFVTPETPDTKSPDMILAQAPPLAFARTG